MEIELSKQEKGEKLRAVSRIRNVRWKMKRDVRDSTAITVQWFLNWRTHSGMKGCIYISTVLIKIFRNILRLQTWLYYLSITLWHPPFDRIHFTVLYARNDHSKER